MNSKQQKSISDRLNYLYSEKRQINKQMDYNDTKLFPLDSEIYFKQLMRLNEEIKFLTNLQTKNLPF